MDSVELLPCPSCGRYAEIHRQHGPDASFTWIECSWCPMATSRRGWVGDDAAIVDALAFTWNRRLAALAPAGVGEDAPMTVQQIEQWIDACNHRPAREVLREYITLRFTARPDSVSEAADAADARGVDGFNGDNAALVECIRALLDLDGTGSLAPHGVGGNARALLTAAAARLPV